MNSSEKGYLPFEGIFDLFSITEQHPPGATHLFTQNAKLFPEIQRLNAFCLPTARTNILRTVKVEPVKMTASGRSRSGQRQVSSEKLSTKSVDNIDLGRIKSQNCQRIVVLGAPKVGKTNLLQRFLGRDFKDHYEPTREDFHRKLFHIGGETYRVDLLDAACERDFPAKRRLSILTGASYRPTFQYL